MISSEGKLQGNKVEIVLTEKRQSEEGESVEVGNEIFVITPSILKSNILCILKMYISKINEEQYPLNIGRDNYNDIIRGHLSIIKGRFNADWNSIINLTKLNYLLSCYSFPSKKYATFIRFIYLFLVMFRMCLFLK